MTMNRFKKGLVTLAVVALIPMARGEEMPIVQDVRILASAQTATTEADSKADIKKAQQQLIDLGYLTGAADGIIGPMTTSAIRAFQERYELSKTGKLDAQTVNKLNEVALSRGSVKEIQQRLIDLGFLHGNADGIFGQRSKAALKLFQQFGGLSSTGEIDDGTRILLFSDSAPSLPKALGSGDSGDAVTALQERLALYGFMEGSADGSYGKQTAAAVKRFQQHLMAQDLGTDMGVTANGEASSVTQFFLYGDDYSSYLHDIEPGVSDDEALRVETRLRKLGYMDLPADDTLDDYAIEALSAFRKAAGLAPSDKADKAVINALFSEGAPQASHFVAHPISLGDTGLAVDELEQALLLGGMTTKLPDGQYDKDIETAVTRVYEYLTARKSADAQLFKDASSLSVKAQWVLLNCLEGSGDAIGKKSTAADISRVQRRLYSLYYLPSSGIDGLLGSNTADALKTFQQANGLSVTGAADEATVKVLFSDKARVNPLPYRVEVDIDNQRVYVYALNDRDEYEKVKTFICSTGLNNSTPRGVFLDGFPVNRWHYFQKFNCWAQYSFEVEGGIMFHSVLYSSNNESTLRVNSVYALGGKASHGCIRLKVEDAKWLFEHCKRGTLVIVIY